MSLPGNPTSSTESEEAKVRLGDEQPEHRAKGGRATLELPTEEACSILHTFTYSSATSPPPPRNSPRTPSIGAGTWALT